MKYITIPIVFNNGRELRLQMIGNQIHGYLPNNLSLDIVNNPEANNLMKDIINNGVLIDGFTDEYISHVMRPFRIRNAADFFRTLWIACYILRLRRKNIDLKYDSTSPNQELLDKCAKSHSKYYGVK